MSAALQLPMAWETSTARAVWQIGTEEKRRKTRCAG